MRIMLKIELGIRKIKVGHAGTLDPLATGLLILCIGKFTKKIDEYQVEEKEYTGTITLGGTTPSYDLETEVDQTFPTDHITKEMLVEAAGKLTGWIEQMPPVFSAKKVDGKRAYLSARQGVDVKLQPRSVEIPEFEITRFENNEVDFRISCSKGTYIRSIAHDFGKLLNSGGHLTKLRRTRIGYFYVEESQELDAWRESMVAMKDDAK
jgi:tRNA pseudouridine55 synthase